MAQRFRDAGFPDSDIQVLGPNDARRTSSWRCTDRASTSRLLIGHLDVVEAKREDWTTDPFKFVSRKATSKDAAPPT